MPQKLTKGIIDGLRQKRNEILRKRLEKDLPRISRAAQIQINKIERLKKAAAVAIATAESELRKSLSKQALEKYQKQLAAIESGLISP